MQAEDLILNHGCQWQVIEQIGEVLPNIGIAILAEAFIVEAVDLGDLSTLMIASQNRDSVLEAHLQADQECDRLHAIVAPVDVVTHKQIVRVW